MWQNGDFRRLLTSNWLLWQTLFMEGVVVSWLVLELTNSPWLLSLAGFCRTAPFLLGGFAAGTLSDRFGRRKVMLAAQSINLLVYATMTALLSMERLTLWPIMVTAALLGVAWALDWPARSALLPDLVGKPRVVEATLLVNLTQTTGRIVGPVLAGAFMVLLGATGSLAVMWLLSALAWFNLWRLAKPTLARTNMPATGSPWRLMQEGLRYVRQSQPILGVLLITLVINLLYFPPSTLLAVFARNILNQGPIELGVLGAANGIGALAGLLLVGWLRHRVSSGSIFAIGSLAMTLLLALFAFSTNYILSCVLLLAAGVGEACFVIMQSSIILLAASDQMRSRALGTLLIAISSDPLGKLQTGFLAERIGAPWTVGIQASFAALCVLGVTLALPGLRHPLSERSQTP